ncbi:MAG: hypothetical protein ACRET4_04725, partial [Steroidobacteraceae bacterium]
SPMSGLFCSGNLAIRSSSRRGGESGRDPESLEPLANRRQLRKLLVVGERLVAIIERAIQIHVQFDADRAYSFLLIARKLIANALPDGRHRGQSSVRL